MTFSLFRCLTFGYHLLCHYLVIISGTKPGNFDIVIENDNFSHAYEKLREFITSNLKEQGKAGTIIKIPTTFIPAY